MSGQPTPVTAERLRTLATTRGDYVRDVPGGVVLHQDGRAHEVVVRGQDLVIRSRWPKVLPDRSRRAAAQLVNDWNRDRIFPTLHTEHGDAGVRLVARHATNVRHGLTQEQLEETLSVVIGVIAHAMRTLDGAVSTAPESASD